LFTSQVSDVFLKIVLFIFRDQKNFIDLEYTIVVAAAGAKRNFNTLIEVLHLEGP
jgi:hypothetical protein